MTADPVFGALYKNSPTQLRQSYGHRFILPGASDQVSVEVSGDTGTRISFGTIIGGAAIVLGDGGGTNDVIFTRTGANALKVQANATFVIPNSSGTLSFEITGDTGPRLNFGTVSGQPLIVFSDGAGANDVAIARTGAATASLTGQFSIITGLTFPTGTNVALATTGAGTQIGTGSTQKLAFLGASPRAQETNSTDLAVVLSDFGLRASGGNPPLNLGTGALTSGALTASGTLTFTGDSSAAQQVVLGTTHGLQIGTNNTSQLLGFLGATPIVQEANSVDLGQVLSDFGLRASGGNPPLNLGTGAITNGAITSSGLATFNALVAVAGATSGSTALVTYGKTATYTGAQVDFDSGAITNTMDTGATSQIGLQQRQTISFTNATPSAFGMYFGLTNAVIIEGAGTHNLTFFQTVNAGTTLRANAQNLTAGSSADFRANATYTTTGNLGTTTCNGASTITNAGGGTLTVNNVASAGVPTTGTVTVAHSGTNYITYTGLTTSGANITAFTGCTTVNPTTSLTTTNGDAVTILAKLVATQHAGLAVQLNVPASGALVTTGYGLLIQDPSVGWNAQIGTYVALDITATHASTAIGLRNRASTQLGSSQQLTVDTSGNLSTSGNLTTTGSGTLTVAGNIGFNGKSPQATTGWSAPTATALRTAAPNATYSTTGATGATVGAFDTQAHRDNIITDLANTMQRLGTLIADLRANGVIG